MPNVKSAKKRVKTNKKRELRNKMVKSNMKTTIKKFLNLLKGSTSQEEINTMYNHTIKTIDKAKSKGILHKNNAARKKSALTLYLNKNSAA